MTEPTHVARGLAGEEIPDGEDRILTAPNLITLVRLLCIPLFLWLLFGRDDRFWAAALLAVLGATDWVDGYVARHFGQVSNLGKMFDPTVDRLLMVVGIAAIMLDDLQVSWFMPFAWVVVVREVLLSTFVVLTVALGARRMDVSWFGKAGTFALLYAFPLLLLAQWPGAVGEVARAAGWAFAWWGIAFYWLAAVLYVRQAVTLVRETEVPSS